MSARMISGERIISPRPRPVGESPIRSMTRAFLFMLLILADSSSMITPSSRISSMASCSLSIARRRICSEMA